ncbi:MAG TPA: CRISPR-associated endonuclease Cas1, partial [Thermoplasmataceae archaeon]|nr:CRISPR-associated endonuclease Cas1 [Thermoplasmataceae archaeon]
MYTFYISQNGSIERSGNTLYFVGDSFKRHMPVMNVSDIVISAKVSVSSWAIDYMSKLGIAVHFVREDGRYLSSLFPYNRNERGSTTVKQALAYANSK